MSDYECYNHRISLQKWKIKKISSLLLTTWAVSHKIYNVVKELREDNTPQKPISSEQSRNTRDFRKKKVVLSDFRARFEN
jgi:hypothetical protein